MESLTKDLQTELESLHCSRKPNTLTKDLLKELECPVCLEYIQPPIRFCGNGHSICNTCRERLKTCPTCKGTFINIKIVALENLATKINYPCRYENSGCKEIFLLSGITQHENQCLYKPYQCPYHIFEECSWKSPLSDMKKHIESTHKYTNKVAGPHVSELKIRDSLTYPASEWNEVVLSFDEIFYRHYRLMEKHFYTCVQYLGPRDKARNFLYRIGIVSKTDEESVSAYCIVKSYMDDIEELIENEDCAVLHRKFALKCITSQKSLYIEEEICQRKF